MPPAPSSRHHPTLAAPSAAAMLDDPLVLPQRLALDALPVAVLLVGPDDRVWLANRRAGRLLGCVPEALVGLGLEALLSGPSRARFALLRATLAGRRGGDAGLDADPDGEPVTHTLTLAAPHGPAVSVELGLSPAATPRGPGLLLTLAPASAPVAGPTPIPPPAPTDERQRLDDARFRLMISSVRDYALLMIDAHGFILSWNAGAERLKGYAEHEIVGQHFSNFYPPEDIASDKPGYELKYALKEGRFEDEGWRVKKDGSRFWANVIITPMHAADGHLLGFSKVTRDMTRRKSAEDRFQLMVEAAPNAMVMADGAGRIVIVNSQTERLFGYSRAELLGQAVARLIPDGAFGLADGLPPGEKFSTTQSFTREMLGHEVTGRTRDGRAVPIEIDLNPIETAEGNFVLVSVIDITERKRAASALASSHREMAAQVSATERAMARLRETQNQLVQAEKLASLGGLVAGIAHEINTPVGNTYTAASHLHDEVAGMVARFDAGQLKRSEFAAFVADSQEAARIILANTARAADLIHSFKMIAVDQSSGDARELDMRGYLHELMLSLRPQFRRGRVEARVDCPEHLRVVTTPGGLSQVITNLVANALTHAFGPDEAGAVTIAVRPLDGGGRLELRFTDDGRGMAPDILGKIFDPFFTTRRGSGGSGLGLHIVYNIVEQTLGGTIGVDSEMGRGSVFTVVFPVGRPVVHGAIPESPAGVGEP